MRVELNSGGLLSGIAVQDFQSDFDSLIDRSRRMISSFQAVKNFTYNMNGGVGNLQSAVDQIDARTSNEESKTNGLEGIQRKANSFIELTRKVDEKACGLVNRNKHEFYEVNPWSKPPQTEEEKKWYEKAGEWLCNAAQTISDGINNIKDTVVGWGKAAIDTISKAWNSAVEWFKEHAGSILKLAISALIVISLVAVIVLCPYTVPVFLATMGLIGAGTKVATELYETASDKGLGNVTFDDFADSVFKGTVKGTASGVSNGIGMYYGPGWRFVAGEFLESGANVLINETDYFIENGTLKGSGSKVWDGIREGAFENTFESAFFAVGSKIGGKVPINNMHNQILFGSKENAASELLADNIRNIQWNIAGSNATKIINDELKERLNNSVDVVDINISGDGFGASVADTIKGTLKTWLKNSLKPTEVM